VHHKGIQKAQSQSNI